MIKVSPLKGITYNLDKVDIKNVIAPPYDVISEQDQEKLYNLSENNIVRLILGKIYKDDNDNNNRYTRAADDFHSWLETGALKKSSKPCIYYYIQEYTTDKGEFVSRKGFIARNRIEDFASGNVLPHEYTMGGPKADRLKVMKASKANFSQVFMLYSDPEKQVDKAFILPEKAFIDVTDPQGVRNIVYIIDDQAVINKVCALMTDKTLLIADGHHRYETAIAYRNYMREQNPDFKEDDKFNFVMSYFTNLDDENLKVFPTHRIITRKLNATELLKDLKQYFDIEEFSFNKSNKNDVRTEFTKEIEKRAEKNIVFGAYFKNVDKYYLISLREKEIVNQILEDRNVPDVLKKLDLSVLHKVVITDILGFSEEDQMKQNGIAYIKKEDEAIEAVENNAAEVVFIMASPKIQDIKEVSKAGFRMPQKSTYFYPKLLSGLVLNPLN